ncbi:UNVERIFIED_CONTAM: UDP-glucuronate 4-epimerase 1 [Sesamum latifolium]|uniref:UDP-glucuronate 4-epimerase 1 n=1 Tax=Sesamum latifolium TaxID=2727402 RepID=A0AAW2VKB1_9LAMI
MRSSAEEELFLPSTPGKFKDRSHAMHRQFHRCFASTSTMFLWALFLVALTAAYLSFQSFVDSGSRYFATAWGGIQWEKQVRSSAQIHRQNGFSVLVTGAAGFVGTHVSLALKKRGDGVVGLDNFNNYYDLALKRARRNLLSSHNIFIVEGDVNDARMLAKLFEIVAFTHVMHLAAQAGVRYAMENPHSYVHSNIAGLVTLLEACKKRRPATRYCLGQLQFRLRVEREDTLLRIGSNRPTRFSVRRNEESRGRNYPFLQPHLRVVNNRVAVLHCIRPMGQTRHGLLLFSPGTSCKEKPITIYRGKNRVDLARDFTYIDDIVKGCVASLDTAKKSTGSGGKKRRPAQYRIFNLGNTSPVTVPMMVGILEKQLKVKARKKMVEMPGNGDVPFTHANISSARRELGYKPTTDLQTGLKKFVRWYLSYYGDNRAKSVN